MALRKRIASKLARMSARREGVSILELFPDEEAAEEWFVQIRWPDGVCCCVWGSSDVAVPAVPMSFSIKKALANSHPH